MSKPQASDVPAKPWGGRFSEATDAFVEAFTASVQFDRRMYAEDIAGSVAHARMLGSTGIIGKDEADRIITGLGQIREEIEAGRFEWSVAREDVHMNIEARLVEICGDVGKKLHTGRSRNDQVATDLRLHLRAGIDALQAELLRLQQGLLTLAEAHCTTIMPGFTHLQAAQPITLAHHLMAWFCMLRRDRERLQDCRRRVNVCPLGSAALAGTTFPIDRLQTMAELGFEGITSNSLDAVSDRDFAIEFCAAGALLMTHLSRMAEELVLWNSPQFGFVDLPDRFCTGSSIMPQKKNPDVPELVRGKTGRVNGNLIALLTLMKGQPLAYNKDNQEDKEPVFDTLDTTIASTRAFADMIPALQPVAERMRTAAAAGFSTATDLADYLVRKGVPFRDAHEVVGKAVQRAISENCGLEDLPLATLQALHASIAEDVADCLTLEGSVEARNHPGGTAPGAVRESIRLAREQLG